MPLEASEVRQSGKLTRFKERPDPLGRRHAIGGSIHSSTVYKTKVTTRDMMRSGALRSVSMLCNTAFKGSLADTCLSSECGGALHLA